MTQPSSLNISMPSWLQPWIDQQPPASSDEEKMALVIAASAQNIAEGSGGPFAAGVFRRNSSELVALGVNLVTSAQLSALHGEVVALSLAQQKLHTYDLSQAGDFELVTSTEPCAMCYGALVWSGITRLLTGATDAHARAIGFDEGPKLKTWQQALSERGIEVVTKVLSEKAKAVLDCYQHSGATIYNGRQES